MPPPGPPVAAEALVGLRQPGPEGSAVQEIHVHGANRHPLARHLRADRERDAFVGLHVDHQHVRPQPLRRQLLERRMRCALELDRDRRLPPREPLSHTHVEGCVRPAPVVDVELRGDVGVRGRLRVDPLLFAVAGHLLALDEAAPVLSAHDRFRTGRVHCAQDLYLLVPDGVGREVDRRLHRRDREQLQEVVLEDVANRTGLLVVARAALDPDRLSDGDLDVVDHLTVPDRLEDPVREAQGQHVLDRFLAEVVVDPEDLVLFEVLLDRAVELACRGEIVAERLLDDEPRPAFGAAPLAERLDNRPEHDRRDCEVVDTVAARAALFVKLGERGREPVLAFLVGEVRWDVAHAFGQRIPDVFAELVARVVLDRFLHSLAELVIGLLGAGHADEAEAFRQQPAKRERVQRREELALREVAGGAEDREDAWIRSPPDLQAFEQGVLLSRGHLRLEVVQSDPHDLPPALLQRAVVALGLRANQAAEAELAAGDRDLVAGVVGDLDEHTGLRAALVQLTCGVQVARAKAARDNAPRLMCTLDQRLQLLLAHRVDERLDRDVVRWRGRCQELVQRTFRLELRIVARGEHLARLVLGGLHVGLIEGIDLQDRAHDRDRELPAEELSADRVGIGDLDVGRLSIVALWALAGRRHESLALLARRLRHELLRPETEASLRLSDAHLFAPLPPAVPQLQAELEPRVRLAAAGLRHAHGIGQQSLDVDVHQRRRDYTEGRKRGVAPADRRLAGEDTHAARVCHLLELGARIGDGCELLALDAERALQDLWREARPAHAQQDKGLEVCAGGVREFPQLAYPLLHPLGLVEPAEPLVLVRAGPNRGVARPDALDELLLRRDCHYRLMLALALRASRECRRAAPRTSRRTSARPPARVSRRRRRSRRPPWPGRREACAPDRGPA